MFGLNGKLTAQPGKREELIGYLLEAAEVLGDLEGCYLYVVSAALDDPDAVWVQEVWRSRDDHRASLELDAVRTLISRAGPILGGSPEAFEVEPHGGKGLPD